MIGWKRFFNMTFMEFTLAMFFIGAAVLCLAIVWTILFGGGVEYSWHVSIGKD